MIPLRLLVQDEARARSLACERAGISMPANIAIIAITTNSSMSVNFFILLIPSFVKVLSVFVLNISLCKGVCKFLQKYK